ncbi:TRAP transporter small permease [Ammoniphilus sp. 3BR4]|uniref:TRAP transporter small permease n=1 Tax=Ammoniphilus sp. 3BR4 TaxID=3158265 RepID=UPI0034657081
MKNIWKNWLEILTGMSLAIVVLATFTQVLFRFVFKIPAPWTEEVTRIAFAYMVFLGAVLGAKHNLHLSVDILGNAPAKLRKIVLSIGYFASILFISIFSYYGLLHSINSKVQTTPTMEISLFYIYLILPFSGVLMAYYLVKNMISDLRNQEVDSQ